MMWGSFGLAISMMVSLDSRSDPVECAEALTGPLQMLSVLLSFSRPGYSEALSANTAKASVAFFFTYMLIFGATANCIPWV